MPNSIKLFQFELYLYKMEEKPNKKSIQFILEKYLNQMDIDNILKQIKHIQKYSINNLQNRCFKKEIIYKIIMYLQYRQTNNCNNQLSKDREILQYQIKRWFMFLPSGQNKFKQICNSSNYFLIELLILSQIVHKIIQNLNPHLLSELPPQIIFIIIVFLSTDKLVSPHCYPFLHKKLLHKQSRTLTNIIIKAELSQSIQNDELKSFKEELTNTLYRTQIKKQPIKKIHSVSIMRNNYTNKSNVNHQKLFRELKSDHFYNIQPIIKERRIYSQVIKGEKRDSSNSQSKWSKCELAYKKYIPFSNIETNINRSSHKKIHKDTKYSNDKKKTSIFLQKRRNLLKI